MGKTKIRAAINNIVVFVICLILVVLVTIVSLASINHMSGNAKVINYAGIVRGGSQKLFKMELAGAYNNNTGKYGDTEVHKRDQLISRLSKIVNGLQIGDGGSWGSREDGNYESFKFRVPDDKKFLDYMQQIQVSWSELQTCIYEVRDDLRSPEELYDLSEKYFQLCNDMVAAAEEYSENQVTDMRNTLFAVDIVFFIFIVTTIAMMVLSESNKRKVESLGKLAYFDILTTLNNRTACEEVIEKIKNRTGEEKKSVGVMMLDMNNLKLANNFLGHQGGDKIIKAFGECLNQTAQKHNVFAGRYGGDEFIFIAENIEENKLIEIQNDIHLAINEYNKLATLSIEKISFAIGFAFAEENEDFSINDLIYKADKEMYENKRLIKEKIQNTDTPTEN
ncbi:MAG: GGDEF domain-containing protein [Oscillospiraceae bacterium]|jgi:diguanylate cyclase (GGDEF)-like protein|nr:GGDEF domain-containing protein [Oscillospiraceae bacterium]